MKFLKNFGLFLLFVVILLLGFSLYYKKEATVVKEIIIQKPISEVFNYTKLLKNQQFYSVWNLLEPNMQKSYTGTDGTVGFISAWNGKKMGMGEQEIKFIEENKRIDFELRFKLPIEAINPAFFEYEAIDSNSTKLSWGFQSKMSWPSNVMLLFIEKSVGNDFQTGLNNLKKILEKKQ